MHFGVELLGEVAFGFRGRSVRKVLPRPSCCCACPFQETSSASHSPSERCIKQATAPRFGFPRDSRSAEVSLSDNPYLHRLAFVAFGASTFTLLGKLVQGVLMHTHAKPQGVRRSIASSCNESTETGDVQKNYAPS